MNFRSEDYFRASAERRAEAYFLYEHGHYALAAYCAGVAVEAMLRGFIARETKQFDSRHDILDMAKRSGILRFNEEFMRRRRYSDDKVREEIQKLRTSVQEVCTLWDNGLRYASEERLRSHLKSIKQLGSGSDPLRQATKRLLDSAGVIMNRGVQLWTQKKR